MIPNPLVSLVIHFIFIIVSYVTCLHLNVFPGNNTLIELAEQGESLETVHDKVRYFLYFLSKCSFFFFTFINLK
jgi:hypothetical protein